MASLTFARRLLFGRKYKQKTHTLRWPAEATFYWKSFETHDLFLPTFYNTNKELLMCNYLYLYVGTRKTVRFKCFLHKTSLQALAYKMFLKLRLSLDIGYYDAKFVTLLS